MVLERKEVRVRWAVVEKPHRPKEELFHTPMESWTSLTVIKIVSHSENFFL